jgi:hypothetical protein
LAEPFFLAATGLRLGLLAGVFALDLADFLFGAGKMAFDPGGRRLP